MHIICLTPLAPGVYNDHKADHITAPPDGWAYIPEDFPLPSTFPRLGSIEAEELTYTRDVEVPNEDGEPVTEIVEYTMMTVTAMTEGSLPEEPTLTPAQQREASYNTAKIIPWEGGNITVTEAAQLWQYYAAEGNMKAYDLQSLIAKAKAEIRAQYPDA
jgi:hypothetical protein